MLILGPAVVVCADLVEIAVVWFFQRRSTYDHDKVRARFDYLLYGNAERPSLWLTVALLTFVMHVGGNAFFDQVMPFFCLVV